MNTVDTSTPRYMITPCNHVYVLQYVLLKIQSNSKNMLDFTWIVLCGGWVTRWSARHVGALCQHHQPLYFKGTNYLVNIVMTISCRYACLSIVVNTVYYGWISNDRRFHFKRIFLLRQLLILSSQLHCGMQRSLNLVSVLMWITLIS